MHDGGLTKNRTCMAGGKKDYNRVSSFCFAVDISHLIVTLRDAGLGGYIFVADLPRYIG